MSRKAPWENNERHYCAVCNAWMGSDRQSILIHNNGKKHQENAAKHQEQQRLAKKQQEQQQSLIQKSLAQMESAARQTIAQDLGRYSIPDSSVPFTQPITHGSNTAHPVGYPSVVPRIPTSSQPPAEASAKKERKDWESRKKERAESHHKSRNDSNDDENAVASNGFKVRLAPGQGSYERDSKVYLEGVSYGDILEPEMPVQLWTGSALANDAEKRLPERDMYWKNVLVVDVRKKATATELKDRLVVDVAYLASPDDTQESLERSVALSRIRIILGADPSIPNDREEARLLAMGGEEIIVQQKSEEPEVDEATGLSSWSTVKVKRTTIRQEVREERERMREKRKREAMEEARKAKEAELRRMEEAKVANADDSALGAFDVWSRNQDGYKGVAIHEESKIDVHEFGKKLSAGQESVSFKRKDFKNKAKKQCLRRKSVDDD